MVGGYPRGGFGAGGCLAGQFHGGDSLFFDIKTLLLFLCLLILDADAIKLDTDEECLLIHACLHCFYLAA